MTLAEKIRRFVIALIQLFLVAGAVPMGMTACATHQPDPVVITKNVVIAPADNLLVDCDVAPPPAKAAYVKTAGGINPNQTLQKDDAYYLTQYANTIKVLQERERLLTEHALKQFQNLDTCNKRWKALREWKTTAQQQLSTPQKE
jgi:hypothetical protein